MFVASRSVRAFSILAVLTACLTACQGDPATVEAVREERPESPTPVAVDREQRSAVVRIVFLGDSLTAGLGLPEEEAFPALVERRLLEEGLSVRAVNAGVSGDTSAGGLSRLDWLLRQSPDILFVSLGANDGLRGLSPEMTERNLRQIVDRARASGARVILAGMRLPPNYGPEYVHRFEAVFPAVARELDVTWIPFLLEGVAGQRWLNLADGIHPNAAGHRKIAEHVLPDIRTLVEDAEGN